MLFDEIEQYSDVLRYIVDGVKDKAIKISILYGSGLSIKSGNLNSYDICKAILNAVNGASGEILLSKDTIEQVLRRTIQLEDFLMRLFDDLNFTNGQKNIYFRRLFKILYSFGEPNTYHYFLAELFKKSISTRIYTTNFDTHFETAFKTQGFKEKYCRIIIDMEYDSKIVKIEDNPNKLYFKLHGCISKAEIATLLPYVASKANIDNLKPILKNLFFDDTNNKHEVVLVLGYSFSDAYDISKIIMEMNEKEDAIKFKEVIIINYEKDKDNKTSKSVPIDEFNINYYNTNHRKIYMNRFPIKIFNCDTDKFIEDIWNELQKNELFDEKYDDYKDKPNDKPENTVQQNVEKQIIELFKEFGKYYIYLMAWRFNYECGQDLIIYNRNDALHKPDEKQKIAMEDSLKRAKEICGYIKNMKGLEAWQYNINSKHLGIVKAVQEDFDAANKEFDFIIKNYIKDCLIDEFNCYETRHFKYDLLIKYLPHDKVIVTDELTVNANELSDILIPIFIRKHLRLPYCFDSNVLIDSQYVAYRPLNQLRHKFAILLAMSASNAIEVKKTLTNLDYAIDFFREIGRVEYLAQALMQKGCFCPKKAFEKAEKVLKEAKYYFENLGYKAYAQLCKKEIERFEKA